MIRLNLSLAAWQTPAFNAVAKAEIEQLDADLLPLQAGLSQSSSVAATPPRAMILSVTADPASLHVKAGLFYSGRITGCSCADDPTPIDETNEYCEVDFAIDRTTAATVVTLLA